ncbi:MAG: class I SAM-dependent methyltransferase [Verrucomicrobiota bacterium]
MIQIGKLPPVAETMLWPLYGRAAEARRPDAKLRDPLAIRVADSIDYDYAKSFGRPDFGHAARALAIDAELESWIADHPDGQIVALGEGLETQFWRVDNGSICWLSVDLEETIELRRQLLDSSPSIESVASPISDLRWMDSVESDRDVFVTAAGVLMYLEPNQVQALIAAIAERFPRSMIVFDGIPRWLSRLTMEEGWQMTPDFTLPPMPWGMDRTEIDEVRDWSKNIAEVDEIVFRGGRGLAYGGYVSLMRKLPKSDHQTPFLLRLTCRPS